jgi:hypothetical protein
MKILRALFATMIFAMVLSLTYWLHITFFGVDVVFYAAIFDGIVAALSTGGLLFGMRFFNCLTMFERSQLVIIWMLCGYSFAISVPTVIDRSLSFYILEKIQQRGGGIRLAQFPAIFTKEYLQEHRLVDVRLTEQLASGTIVIENGCVKLTPKGKRLATGSRYFRQHFLPKKRLLMGEYSDVLTDPFRDSHPIEDYKCQ